MQAIVYEIKTPLTAIQGSSEMISEGWVTDEKRIEMAFLDVERMAAG